MTELSLLYYIGLIVHIIPIDYSFHRLSHRNDINLILKRVELEIEEPVLLILTIYIVHDFLSHLTAHNKICIIITS